MIKVLVADDERWIRKGIVRMIDRERNPIGEIWEAENVTQALGNFPAGDAGNYPFRRDVSPGERLRSG